MISTRGMILSAVLTATLAVPALGQSNLGGVITGTDIERIRELAAAYGPAERRQDDQGTWIRGEMDEIVYSISFLNCDDSNLNCTSVQFRAWWESNGAHSVEAMNQWNRDRRFSAAYLDDEGNATIEWDVNLVGGITAVNFDDNLQWWQAVIRQFRESVVDPGFEEANPGQGDASPGK